jgi:hypothetical protein
MDALPQMMAISLARMPSKTSAAAPRHRALMAMRQQRPLAGKIQSLRGWAVIWAWIAAAPIRTMAAVTLKLI